MKKLIFAAATLLVTAAYAQDVESVKTDTAAVTSSTNEELTEKEKARKERADARAKKAAEREQKPVRFFPIPDVSSDPTLGTGGGLMAMLTFPVSKTDTISPKSIVFGKGTYYNTSSYIAIIGSRLYFKEDKLRVPVAFGRYRLVNEFSYKVDENGHTYDLDVDYSANSTFGYLGFNYNVWKRLYVGADYYISSFVNEDVEVRYKGDVYTGDPAKDFLGLNDFTQSGFFINAEWDTRDNQFNPLKGAKSLVQVGIFPEALGTTNSFQQISAFYSYYISPKPNHTIAAQVSGAGVFGELNGNNLATFGIGQAGTMRGYKNGKYQGEYLATLQADYRWYFYKRLGLVGFAGISKFFGDDDKRTTDKVLPSIGGGLRFMVDTKQRIAIRLDAGWGTDENFGFYLGLSEAF